MRLVFALALGLLASCGSRDDDAIRVGAAASLRDVLNDVKPAYEAAHPGTRLVIEFAASSILSRQIEAGGDLDVFVSADRENVDRVATKIVPESIGPVLGNVLCIVARPGLDAAPADPAALANLSGKIAVAGSAVPAGKHARALLVQRGLLARLNDKLVDAEDVRAALALVENGAVDAGIVYATDGATAQRATVTWTARAGEGPAVVYYVGVCKESAANAHEFAQWLRTSPEFRALAAKRGFLPPPSQGK